MQIKRQKIEKFMKDLGSESPTPGGGAVAALSGAMAAGLIEMVANLTNDKKAKALGNRANKLKQKLLDLADEDCRAFDRVMLAYRSKSKFRIEKALEKAIAVPEKTKTLNGEVELLANKMAKIGNEKAISDTKCASHLAVACQKSAAENIKINQKALAAVRQD